MRQLVRSPRLLLSLACVLLAGAGAMVAAERSSSAMAGAATAFLNGLTLFWRQLAVCPFESDERMRWHYIPPEGFPRKGLTVKEMTEPQRALAHALLTAGLSQRGYMTATAIMAHETLLGGLGLAVAPLRARIVTPRRLRKTAAPDVAWETGCPPGMW